MIFDLEPAAYASHALHAHDRHFRETNCYLDVWIEVLHALGLDPHGCLGVTLSSDFEGDQWTFFKPRHGDLDQLYGVRVEELSLWRPLVEQAATQVARRRLPLVEMDSFYLPDTAASDYRKAHVKTTIAITAVDRAARRLRYFHNTAFYELSGEDFDGVFTVGVLPPYCEIIKPDAARALPVAELRALSKVQARHHFARRPTKNPIRAHAEALPQHVELIVREGAATYHGYSFVAMRQLGAGYELAASYARWLNERSEAAAAFEQIAATAKMVILKLARAAGSKKSVDLSASFAEMADAWERGMEYVGRELGA